MLEQDRINAVISYFFLGPLFLLARTGTPLANPYVREHSKQSSIIIGMSFLVGIVYLFLRPYLQLTFLMFDLQAIILTLIIGGCILFLIRGAYQAYHGTSGELRDLGVSDHILQMGNISNVYSVENDEDKVRILASMLPWMGIYLSHKYQNPLMDRARIIGSFFTLLVIFTIFLSGAEGFIAFLMTALYIVVFVMMGVYLFVYERFVLWDMLGRIPSYTSIETHIVATVRASIDFIGVVFGKDKKGNYARYLEEAGSLSHEKGERKPYFMPAWIIALPIINIVTLPSFFITSYRAYRFLIVQGCIITILFILTLFWGSYRENLLLLLLLFPIVHLAVYASTDVHTRAPIIGIWMHILESYDTMKTHIGTIVGKTETSGFVYQVTPPQETPSIKQ